LLLGSRTLKLHGLLNLAALVVCFSICGLSFGLVTFDKRADYPLRFLISELALWFCRLCCASFLPEVAFAV
jgi:hypothetical protein